MSQNLTRIDTGIQLKPSSGVVLSNDGEMKFDNSASGFIVQQAGATGQLVVSSTTGSAPTFSGLTINGNESITGTLGVSGAATINNNLTVTGALAVSGAATVNGAVTINNNESITGTLGVSGAATINGAVTVNNTLSVTGAASAGSLASSAEVLLKEITTPANPAAGFLKVYPKSDDKLYSLNSSGTETAIGSGGAAAFNLLTMDTSFSMTRTNNQDAESTVGDWAAYANGAAVAPTSMSGGSPTSTIARTTSTPLDGAGSFLYSTPSGASYEGEGVSCTANIPPGYRGLNVGFSFVYATTGSIVEDDFRLYAYAMNGASSGVITPFSSGKILGANGKASCVFSLPTDCTQIRVGVHNARSSTGAVTIKFDDVYLTNVVVPVGIAGSDWQRYTMTIGATTTAPTKGTTTIDRAMWRRVGDSAEIIYEYSQSVSGSAGSGAYLFPLPPNLSIDTSKIDINYRTTFVGFGFASDTATNNGQGRPSLVTVWNATNLVLSIQNESAGTLLGTSQDAGSVYYPLSGANVQYFFSAKVPIAGWSSNVQMANSSQFKISSYLASGTRVTGAAPTLLGQYRSYLRNASANTFTETNGNPTTSPTNADGILIYQNTAWGTVNPNNSPTKYDIFVGKNKSVKWAFYKSAGRTGSVDITPSQFTSTVLTGYATSYDPTTGIATIVAPANASSTSASNTGIDETGAEITTAVYFDIVVSENALAVGVEGVRSDIWLQTCNGYGSTNNKIRRFTTIQKNIGTAITYADSATNGASFTINEDGVYSITYVDQFSAGANSGISLNSNQLTTDIYIITAANRLSGANGTAAAYTNNTSWTGILSAGDVIRAHTDGTASGSSTNWEMFRITKVSN